MQQWGLTCLWSFFGMPRYPWRLSFWLWLIWHNSIATKHNMIEFNWPDNTKFQFCNEEETILIFSPVVRKKIGFGSGGRAIGAHIAWFHLTVFLVDSLTQSNEPKTCTLLTLHQSVGPFGSWEKTCFKGKLVKYHVKLICCSYVHEIAFHGSQEQEIIRFGVDALLNFVTPIMDVGPYTSIQWEMNNMLLKEMMMLLEHEDGMDRFGILWLEFGRYYLMFDDGNVIWSLLNMVILLSLIWKL